MRALPSLIVGLSIAWFSMACSTSPGMADGGAVDARVPRRVCTSDRSCPSNMLCEGGVCRRVHEERDAGELCVYGCLAPRALCEAACAADETCVDGACIAGCFPASCDTGCGAAGVCSSSVDQCVPRVAASECTVPCEGTSVCAEVCRRRIDSDVCSSVTCADGQYCVGGRCVVNPCAGVSCASGESCVNGTCVASCRCGGPCAAGEHCEGDRCVCTPRCSADAPCGSDDGCGGTCFGPCSEGRCGSTVREARPSASVPVPRYGCECVSTCTDDSPCGADDGCGGRCPGACPTGSLCSSSGFAVRPDGTRRPLFECQCVGCNTEAIDCGSSVMLACGRPCTGSHCPAGEYCADGACRCEVSCDSLAADRSCDQPLGTACGVACPGMGTRCPMPTSVACGEPLGARCDTISCDGTGTYCADGGRCLEGECCGCPSPSSVACGTPLVASGACAGRACGGSGTSCAVGDCIDGRCIETCPRYLACGASTTLSDGTVCPGEVCPASQVCEQGSCEGAPCTSGCPSGEFCASGSCHPITCERPLCGGACCPSDQVCADGRCRPFG